MFFSLLLILASATVVASGPYSGFTPQELDLIKTNLKTEHGITLLRQLGSGGFGSVFAASNKPGSYLAVKLSRSTTSNDNLWNVLTKMELYALRETSHPNLIRFYGNTKFSFPEYDVMVFFTELLGPNLGSLMKHTDASNGLVPAVVARIALHTSDGLAYLHRQFIAHHDIKPLNLVIDRQLNPKVDLMSQLSQVNFKIIDLSLCIWYKSANDTELFIGGTDFYFSPEKANVDQAYNPFLADAYALGLTLVQTLLGPQRLLLLNQEIHRETGRPYANISLSDAYGKYRSLLSEEQKKQAFYALIADLVEADPAKRITVLEFNRQLKEYLASSGWRFQWNWLSTLILIIVTVSLMRRLLTSFM